jgi:hypothetical protein
LIDDVDKKAETNRLSSDEISLKYYLNERLALIMREAETRLCQRAKVRTLLEGYDNTQYFHMVAMVNAKNK